MQTNQRAELTAILLALRAVGADEPIVLHSDSVYGVKGASKAPGGRLGLTNGSFDLPLHKGANQVAVAIDDNFGGGEQHFGWGLEMRVANTDGIRPMSDAMAKPNAASAR